jgi:hypothetical protein
MNETLTQDSPVPRTAHLPDTRLTHLRTGNTCKCFSAGGPAHVLLRPPDFFGCAGAECKRLFS